MKLEPAYYISVTSAFNKLKKNISVHPRVEFIPFMDSYDRVLARDIVCNSEIPKHDVSHMDGFAVKSSNIANASKDHGDTDARLSLLDGKDYRIRIGVLPRFKLKDGEACPIPTGGFLPQGADAIVPQEKVEKDRSEIKIKGPVSKGDFVYPAGSDIKKGRRILAKGKTSRAQDVGLLASLHITKVPVFAKPRVAVIPTGSELTDKIEETKCGRIFNTNSHVIAKLVEGAGGIALDLGVTPDKTKSIEKKIKTALTNADLVITLGGSSVGKYDLVENAIDSFGKPGMLVHGVKLDRGRVTGLASSKGKPVIILPGPIQGAASGFVAFAYPMITFLSGLSSAPSLDNGCGIPAKLTENWQARKRFPYFTKIVYVDMSKSETTGFVATPLHGETESMSLLVRSNGYVVVPEETTTMNAGEQIRVNLLPGFSYSGVGKNPFYVCH